ncbi:MAG: glycerol-3-phosphate 1-O-acyltransferase PlsY [Erysipelotrichaceae bacterium]|nr:glycerol-3-phosphate 1-O-acyltransferase PlsY [Erysipelotrichaceae bacterium]
MVFNIEASQAMLCVLFIILSYIIGSIPFGILIGKGICHIDIREHGSKNIGSTNAIRVLGKKVGFLVFFCDVFKGMVVIILLKILASANVWTTPIEYFFYGAAAIIGHCFSIFLGFKGGKAVATSLGVVLILTPIPAVACLIVFLITLYTTGYVSLGSTFATITVIASTWILYFFGVEATSFWDYFISSPTLLVCILYSILSTLIILKHTKNYARLIKGTESNFKKKKKEAKLLAEQQAQQQAQ